MLKFTSISFITILFFSCANQTDTSKKNSSNEPITPTEAVEISKSQTILNEAILAHGGNLYDSAHYSFDFRDNTYQFKNEGYTYEYSKTVTRTDTIIKDILTNDGFNRLVNNVTTLLSDKEKESGVGAINSVIYFATLPYKLNDKAVNTIYIDSIQIKDQSYDVIEITFDQAGGGEDHDDEYYYWINKENKKIDYFAYNYSVNNGGVRFRSAYNSRVVDGITFQDYINHSAEVGTPLNQLPSLYEAGELVEVSKVLTENVINLK